MLITKFLTRIGELSADLNHPAENVSALPQDEGPGLQHLLTVANPAWFLWTTFVTDTALYLAKHIPWVLCEILRRQLLTANDCFFWGIRWPIARCHYQLEQTSLNDQTFKTSRSPPAEKYVYTHGAHSSARSCCHKAQQRWCWGLKCRCWARWEVPHVNLVFIDRMAHFSI